MQVSVESTSPIGRRLTVSIPADQVQTEINQKTVEVSRTKRIDGFRPGKVPKQLIQQKFGAQIRHEAISKIIETSLPTALQQEALEPAGIPEVERVLNVNEDGKDLTYIVHFEIFPEVTLPEFSTLDVEQLQSTVEDKDIDQYIEKLRNQLATFSVVERAAKKGDRLTIDYTSTMNGKPYENSNNNNVQIELGSSMFIEGFEDALIGAVVGDTRELDLQFPSEWRMEKLAGKPVHFSVTIKEVAEKQLAELNESFAKKIGASTAETSDIREKVRENLDKQVAFATQESARKQVLDKLLKLCDIELPKALVEREMGALHEDLHRRMGNQAHDTCHHQGLDDEAKRRVTLSLLLRKIVSQENLTPDNTKVREKIAEIAKSFGNAEFIENMYYESQELLSGVQNTVLVEQAIEIILAKAKISYKKVSVEELFSSQV